MNDDDRLWLNLKLGLVIGVVLAAAGALFQRASTNEVLAGSAILVALGLIGIALVRAGVHGHAAPFWRSSAGRRALAAVLIAAVTLGGAYAAWSVWTGPAAETEAVAGLKDSPPEAAPVPSEDRRARILAAASRLAGREWALEGERCAPDGIRFSLEGNELVALPKDSPPMRHSIVDAAGQKLTTRVDGRTVEFLIREDGFIYVDGGVERWFQLCA